MTASVRRNVIGWMAAAILVAALVACEEEPSEPARLQPAGYGVVHGVLGGTEGPYNWKAFLVGPSGQPASFVSALCDSSGAFTLLAPYGRYRLAFSESWYEGYDIFYSSRGLVAQDADDLDLNAGRERIEANAAFLTAIVRLRPDPALRGGTVACMLQGTDLAGDATSRYGNGPCVGDSLTLVISELIPGSYRVRAGSGQGWIDLPVAGDGADPGPLVVRADSVATPWYSVPAPTRVSLQVSGSWPELREIGGVPTLVAFTSDSVSLGARSSDPQGLIQDRWYSPDSVCFRLDVNQVSRWIGGDSFATARRYLLAPGDSLTLPEVRESGMLLRLAFDSPIPSFWAYLRLWSEDGRRLLFDDHTYRNFVALSNLDPGSYRLQIHREDACDRVWRLEWYDDGTSLENSTPIVIRESGELIHVDWRVNDGGVIQGRISAPPSNPDWNRDVDLVAAADTVRYICQEWGSPGGYEFRFTGLADGPYFLRVHYFSINHLRSWWYPGTWNGAEAETLWVRDASVVESGSWEGR